MSTLNSLSSEEQRLNLCGVIEGFYGKPWTFQQRKTLCLRMEKMGLNAYLYAPKDDYKHRQHWRELYNDEEAEHLRCLIEHASQHKVCLIYAISPGLDMTFSSSDDVRFLKAKLDQVASLGCSAFALLFDDIEPELSPLDRSSFTSYGQAQAVLSNDIFRHLNKPSIFLFCPTEYCTSRAEPTLLTSSYLSVIGSQLLPEIDIMWTGPKVISKQISVASIEELTKVIRRAPVLWDNIHANDYDMRRLFLGPYSGRSLRLRQAGLLRGVLTNPNNEFEMNFIAMHTLATWSRVPLTVACGGKAGGNNNVTKGDIASDDLSPKSTKSITEDVSNGGKIGESDNSIVNNKENTEGVLPLVVQENTAYDRRAALKLAVTDWMDIIYDEQSVSSSDDFIQLLLSHAASIGSPAEEFHVPTSTASSMNLLKWQGAAQAEGFFSMLYKRHIKSKLSSDKQQGESDCNNKKTVTTTTSSEQQKSGKTCETSVNAKDGENVSSAVGEERLPSEKCNGGAVSQKSVVQSVDHEDRLSVEELLFLIDAYYLPYEYGPQAVKLLEIFYWLKSHASLNNITVRDESWKSKVSQFKRYYECVCSICDKVCRIPNRPLLYDLYPYVEEMRHAMSIMNKYVKWLDCSNDKMNESFLGCNTEHWTFRGGICAEIQKMIPLEGSMDVLLTRFPEFSISSAASSAFCIRPYYSNDKDSVVAVCNQYLSSWLPCDHELSSFLSDWYLESALGYWHSNSTFNSNDLCAFVLEDVADSDSKLCAFTFITTDVEQYQNYIIAHQLPMLKQKYKDITSVKERLKTVNSDPVVTTYMQNVLSFVSSIQESEFSTKFCTTPKVIANKYPAFLQLCVTSHPTGFTNGKQQQTPDNSKTPSFFTSSFRSNSSKSCSNLNNQMKEDDNRIDFKFVEKLLACAIANLKSTSTSCSGVHCRLERQLFTPSVFERLQNIYRNLNFESQPLLCKDKDEVIYMYRAI